MILHVRRFLNSILGNEMTLVQGEFRSMVEFFRISMCVVKHENLQNLKIYDWEFLEIINLNFLIS